MKAADISDAIMIAKIQENAKTRGATACLWELQDMLPEYPPKVVQAKCKALVRRKVISGCACGCRGDFSPMETKSC